MHHKCVKCGQVYEHSSEEILAGCLCGSKLFYFMKGSAEKKAEEGSAPESDNREMMGNADIEYFYELDDERSGEMIAFDVEAIRVKSSGKYEIDVNGLMGNNGLIYSYGDGKYSIDIDSNMKNVKRKR